VTSTNQTLGTFHHSGNGEDKILPQKKRKRRKKKKQNGKTDWESLAKDLQHKLEELEKTVEEQEFTIRHLRHEKEQFRLEINYGDREDRKKRRLDHFAGRMVNAQLCSDCRSAVDMIYNQELRYVREPLNGTILTREPIKKDETNGHEEREEEPKREA